MLADLNVRRISPAFRQGYWTRNADEPDASILWPGIRQQIGQWIAGESPIVTAALTASSEPVVASRVIFSRSQTLDDLWYYGYFYTLPEFRRLGLGERVMRKGLAEIGSVGARYCSCYVADANQASADLAIKLGFQRLPFVRVVFRAGKEAATQAAYHHPAETYDVRMLPEAMNLIHRVVCGGEGSAVIADELLVRRPWQPWKNFESQLVLLENNDACFGIGRIGPHKTVLLPEPDTLRCDPVGALLSAVSAIRSNRRCPVFAFIPLQILESLRDNQRDLPCEIYNIFWHSRVQEQGW